MGKNENANGLSNVFIEFEKIDLTGKELDSELTELGFDPKDLVRKVREKIDKIKTGLQDTGFVRESKEEFDPFLLAAGKKRKVKDVTKRARKRN
jgi:hypothetical protein